jgi:HSP20 family molecular chaperone IbpA
LRFDVAQYTPEEIVVKTVDNKLLVHAKHEEKSETKSVYREYNREFLLPKGTNPELIRSSLSKVSYFHVWILSSLFGF